MYTYIHSLYIYTQFIHIYTVYTYIHSLCMYMYLHMYMYMYMYITYPPISTSTCFPHASRCHLLMRSDLGVKLSFLVLLNHRVVVQRHAIRPKEHSICNGRLWRLRGLYFWSLSGAEKSSARVRWLVQAGIYPTGGYFSLGTTVIPSQSLTFRDDSPKS